MAANMFSLRHFKAIHHLHEPAHPMGQYLSSLHCHLCLALFTPTEEWKDDKLDTDTLLVSCGL